MFGIGVYGYALAVWRAAKRVRSTEPKASPEGSGGFSRNALTNVNTSEVYLMGCLRN